jgi:hypothetical protein
MDPPPPRGEGNGRPCIVRLESDEVAACATAIFRSPIAPDKTSNVKATSVRHLYIDPPNGKLTRRDHMYFRSKMEQKSYIVSKRLTPLDHPLSSGSFHPVGSADTDLARAYSRIPDLQGQEYVGTTERGSKSSLFNDIYWGDGNATSRYWFAPKVDRLR